MKASDDVANSTPTDSLAAAFTASALAQPIRLLLASLSIFSSVRMSVEAILEGIGLALSRAIAALPNISEKRELNSGNTRSITAVHLFFGHRALFEQVFSITRDLLESVKTSVKRLGVFPRRI